MPTDFRQCLVQVLNAWASIGMLHCGGGEATDQFEMLDAIMDWVEKGAAPDRILATVRSMPGVSRPLCPYPKVARYRGGDAASAESFDCSD